MRSRVNPGARRVDETSGPRRDPFPYVEAMSTERAAAVRQWPRRVALLGLSLLAAPALVMTVATPAHAATGTITEPSQSGQTFTTASTLIIRAQVRRGFNDGGKVTLTLSTPGSSSEYELASHSGGSTSGGTYTLEFTYDPGCPQFPGTPCSGRPAANGTHTIRLRGTSSTVEKTFTMRVPPRKPTGVNATKTGDRQITVRWDRGNEPDLAGYDLFTNGDTAVARGISPDRTEYVVDYPETGYEGQKSFYVVANRRTCPGCSDTVASPRSDTSSAELHAPPPPPPSPDPSYEPEPSPSYDPGQGGGTDPTASPGSTPGSGGGPSTSPSPGSTSRPGTNGPGGGSNPSSSARPSASGSASSGSGGRLSAPVLAQRQAFALQFRNFAPKLGAPKLPPLPDFEDPEYFEEEGTYEETLDFGEQDIEELVTSAQGGGQRSVVEELVSTAFEGRRLWSSIGWSLVLFLVAGHLRRWLNAAQHD